MNRRLFVTSFACLAISSGACSPSVPALRTAPMDSGRAEDPLPFDSACAERSTPDASDASDASETDAARLPDAHDDRAPDFQLVLLDPTLSVLRDDSTILHVRIERVGGFDAPVLIDLWGLPDTLSAQARESRVTDSVLEITIEASEDAEPADDWAYAVQASALGIRRVVRTTIDIE
jgi:hypothetical protein